MLFNIIMAVSLYPCALIIAYFINKSSRYEKSLYFGSYMHKDWYNAPENRDSLMAIKKTYKKEFLIINLLLLAGSIVIFFIPYISIQILLWVIWLFGMIAVEVIPQARAFKKVRAWKAQRGLDLLEEEEEAPVYAEITNEGQGARIKLKDYMLPLIASCLTAISPIISYAQGRKVDSLALPLYITIFVSVIIVILTMLFVTKYINNRIPRAITNDSTVNMNYKRAGDMIWSSVFKQMAWISVIFLLVIALSFWMDDKLSVIVIVASIIYAIAVIVAVLLGSRTQSKVDKRYADKFDIRINIDNDRYWIWGIIYYNPKDSRNFVNTRLGMGLEANLAKPVGKLLNGIGIAAILICIIMCIYPIFMEFTPLSLQMKDRVLQANHLRVLYEIEVDQIENVSLLTELPRMSRTAGNEMEEQLEGDFYVKAEQRKCKVMLNPKNSHFIRIEANGVVYYLGDSNDLATQDIYNSITKK